MRRKSHLAGVMLVSCVLLAGIQLIHAEDSTSQKPNNTTPSSTTIAVTEATTPKPKVNVLESDLCKKCKCDTNVKQLDCSNKGMAKLFTDDQWSVLQNGDITFEIIKLEHNNITTVPQFREYPVKRLYLGFNQITKIEIDAFTNLSDITSIDLSHNNLTSKAMVPDVFRGQYATTEYQPLEHLVELNVGFNQMHNLNQGLFQHVPHLQELILCGNTFEVIDHLTETAISSLNSLKVLDMSFMELEDLPESLLHGPRESLENLILSDNLFTEIPDNIERAINLKRLVLDNNPFGDLDGDNVFPVLPKLEYLSISYMPELTKIAKGALSNLQNLTTFVCTDNKKLSYIDVAAFKKNTTNLEIFDVPIITELDLANNNLTVLERGMLDRWDKITRVDLRFNPWACDCSNDWLINIQMLQINSTTPVLTQDVRCSSPADWREKPLLALVTGEKSLVCVDDSNTTRNGGIVIVSILVGVLIGVPITIGALVLYRRGCFGLVNQNRGVSRSYNRASFTDDFHI